jgi:opacity protein-like surface antigen
MKKTWLSTLLVSVVFTSYAAQATVVVHSLQEQVQGWHTSLEASYATSSSTVEKTDYSGNFRFSNNSDQRQWLMFGDISYSDVNGAKSDDSTMLHARYIHKQALGDVNVEVFAQQERDDFALLASRRLYGAGLAWLSKHDNYAIHSLVGVMDEREEHLTDASQDKALTRFTLSTQVQYVMSNKARLTAVLYYQPAASDFGNYRSTLRASVAFPLSERLDLKLGYAWRYNGEAFVDVPPIKRSLTTGIKYSF